MLTVDQLKAQARLAVGGEPSTTTGYTVDERLCEIINHAGQHLFGESWRFRERTSKLLSLVGGQAWIDLPSDVGEIMRVTAQEPYTYTFHLIAPQEFANLSQNEVVPPVGYIACLSHGTSNDGQPAPRLDLFPTPSQNDNDSIRIRYRVRWVPITTSTPGTYQIQIDEYAEALMVLLVRAYAEGGEDGTTEARLAAIDAGPTAERARGRDGTAQDDYGRLPLRRRFGERGGPPPWGYVAMRPLSDSIEMATTYVKTVGDPDWTFDGQYRYIIPATTHLQGDSVRAAVYQVGGTTPVSPTSLTVSSAGTVTVVESSGANLKRTIVVTKR